MKVDNIANQVFIGCPWKIVRNKYEILIENLKKRYPLSFVIIGRGDQHAEDLLKIIKDELLQSSAAIFDATGGNANVSLEYGIAEAKEIPRAIYISQHKRGRKISEDSAIISDLAGKKRNEYKQLSGLSKLLNEFSKNHSYTKKFEIFFRKRYSRHSKGAKKSARALSLKVIHSMDCKDSVRRNDVVQDLLAQKYSETEINECIKNLHYGHLIRCSEGRYSTISVI